jgi:pyridoxal phosphate enzyme (YggS family)
VSAELRQRLDAVRQRIAAACGRVGRDPGEVTLVCVTKTLPAGRVQAAFDAGARDFGENYGQELRDKSRELAGLGGLRWHFIGPLQRNKVKYVAGTATLIHTLASPEVIEAVDRRAAGLGIQQQGLVQLNLSGEATKSGVAAEDLERLLDCFASCGNLSCAGLMTMPPFFDEPHRARPLFAELRRLRDQAARTARPRVDLRHLSMGMSGDFEVAVEEGATHVRVGTAIMGPRGQVG